MNDRPLVFFHFSGIEPEDMERISKHQDRFTLSQLPAVEALFVDYRRLLLKNGLRDAAKWAFAYARFDNGVRIPAAARALYRSLGAWRSRFGDPFAAGVAGGGAAAGSFFAWMTAPARWAPPPARPTCRGSSTRWRGRATTSSAASPIRTAATSRASRSGSATAPPKNKGSTPSSSPRSRRCSGRRRSPPPRRPAPRRLVRRLGRRLNDTLPVRRLRFHLKRALGAERAAALKRRLVGGRERGGRPAEGFGPDPLATLAIVRPGVNVSGYVRTESGMGEGVRGVIRGLAAAGIPCALHNLELNVVGRMKDRTFDGFVSEHDFDVNLLFVNADQVPQVADYLGRERFHRRYNIGFWLWELEEFPPEWISSFGYFHEIWTPSAFCQGSLGAVSPVPVRRVALPVGFELAGEPRRADFGLPEDRFVFLFVFDYLSFVERKNPHGLLRAFQRAFQPADPVLLVIKTINSEYDPAAAARLRDEAAGWPVRFLDDYLTKDGVHRLMAVADCYVSLHRSEGFGLTLAEAMFLGKPVIATAYSGNTDFMNLNNSFPVRWRPVAIEEDHGPYRKGWTWADPDLDHAAELMRAVVADPERARAVGEAGRRDLVRDHGVAAMAETLKRRLRRVEELVNGTRSGLF